MPDEPITPDVEPTDPTPDAPDAPEPEPAQPSAGTVEDLPVWAQNLLKDLRSENAKHRKAKTAAQQAEEAAKQQALEEQGKFKELNEQLKAELQQIKAAKAASDLILLKTKVGQKLKLPAALVDRLQGETEEELEADGKALLEAIPQPQVSGTDPLKGTNPQQPTVELTDQEIAERAARLGVNPEHLKSSLGIRSN